MKSLITIFSFVLSVSAFAGVTATEAVNTLIPSGEYSAKECSVNVAISADSVSVKISEKGSALSFTTLNHTENYSVDSATGEFTAYQKLMFPGGGRGGQKTLTIRKLNNSEVEVFVSSIYISHQGDEVGTYLTCAVKL